jgi:hypothetical protein
MGFCTEEQAKHFLEVVLAALGRLLPRHAHDRPSVKKPLLTKCMTITININR